MVIWSVEEDVERNWNEGEGEGEEGKWGPSGVIGVSLRGSHISQ